jgi:type I restriction enzyme S subunit
MLSVDDFLYDGESVCIGRKGTINNPMFLTGKFWTVDTLFYTHSFQQCLPKFIYAIFQNIEWLKHNEAGGVPSLSKTIIEKIQTAVPDIPEQQIIADCLSSLDELIAAQARKVDALKTHKKGLMQQLFPREGETQPRLRFPEFQNAGEWRVKPLAKLFSIGSGKDHQHLAPGSIPVYGSGGYMRSVEEYLYEGESVCIGRKGTINNPMLLSGKFWTVDTLFFTHSFIECLPRFIFLIFQNINWLKHNEAGGVPSLSKLNIEKIEVAIPTILEQQHIADCLSSLDTQITAETQELDALKTHKKGLMQQLFPAPQAAEA